MEKENKNLETQKKKGKNWVFRIGLSLLFLCIVMGGLAYFIEPSGANEPAGIFTGLFLLFFVYPAVTLSMLLIIIGLLLRVRIKIVRAISIPLVILLFYWGFSQIPILGGSDFNESLITVPFEKLAIVTKSEFLCDLMPTIKIGSKDTCYGNLAPLKKNLAICDKVVDSLFRESCYSDVAEAIGDESICEKIKGRSSHDICYRDVAAVKKDPALCEKIIEIYFRSDCYKRTK